MILPQRSYASSPSDPATMGGSPHSYPSAAVGTAAVALCCCWVSSPFSVLTNARLKRQKPLTSGAPTRMLASRPDSRRINPSEIPAVLSEDVSLPLPNLHDDTDPSVAFTNFEESPSPQIVEVTGRLPHYLHGRTYYRVGPARFEERHADGQLWRAQHFFDAVSMIAAFHFNAPDNQVTFHSRVNSTRLLDAIRSTPGWIYRNFRTNTDSAPLWQQLLQWRPPAIDSEISLPYTNYVVGLEDIPGRGLCSRTDVAGAQPVCPRTLAPLKQFRFSELHPQLDGAASMGHGMTDPAIGDYFNVVWSYKPGVTKYQVFCTKKTGETYIVATIRDRAYYMHSASLTDNYIVVTLAPMRIKFVPFLVSLSIGNAVEVVDDENVKFVVVSRKKGGVVRTYSHETFSAMHSIAAFENGNNLVLDWCCSMNAKEMASFDMEDVKGKRNLPNSAITRFVLPDVSRMQHDMSSSPTPSRSKMLLTETGDFLSSLTRKGITATST